MKVTPAITARAQAIRHAKMQPGVILSYTTLAHPPSQFGPLPRTIGLLELDDGSRVMAPLLMKHPAIGMAVTPMMRLSHVTEEKLRIYGVAFEEAVADRAALHQHAFPGYILALTGPSGVGKSAVRNALLKMLGERAVKVPMITTAPRELSERGEYRHMTKKKFEEAAKKDQVVALAQLEWNGATEWYGYRAADFASIWKTGKVPVVTTETHLLRSLSAYYGRRSILSFGLLPPGRSKRAMLSHLLRRLRSGGKHTEEWMHQTLKTAADDLQVLKSSAELFDRILVNDDLQVAAETVRKHLPSSGS